MIDLIFLVFSLCLEISSEGLVLIVEQTVVALIRDNHIYFAELFILNDKIVLDLPLIWSTVVGTILFRPLLQLTRENHSFEIIREVN